jgi:mRNA-degrading endonuclease RelE of RelBE toxin-antitoxin system
MPLAFHSISTFRQSVENLCRKEKNGYQSCKKDICDFFSDLSIEDIWELNTRLREMGSIRVIKVRLKNSFQNLSSSDGFRLIVCCNKKTQTVVFLNIYPKRGKLGQLDQSREEYKRQLKIYAEELSNNKLVKFVI